MKRLHPALVLLGVAVLAYGLLIPHMGFYWDELPMSWIRYELGPEAMTRYFSTNRPVWGMLYQLTTRVLPQIPIYWEIFGLFWRWMSAVLVWAIIRELWPVRRLFALIVSLCFLVYPGFSQQWTSYLYSHFFIVLCFLLFSFLCMLWSFRISRWRWPLTIVAMICSALNLWMMEYFFVLELFRPFLILYFVLSTKDEGYGHASLSQAFSLGQREFRKMNMPGGEHPGHIHFSDILRVFVSWMPYLAVFLANVYWRLFVFNNQIYQPTLIPKLSAAFPAALGELIATVFSSLYAVSIAAWAQIFLFPNPTIDGPLTTVFYAAVALLTVLLVATFALNKRTQDEASHKIDFWPIGLGLVAMFAAGGPFWLTGLDVTLAQPSNRFTLPFMLGVSLLLAGLLELLPIRWRIGLAAGFIGLAAGRQALLADAYSRDWSTQKTMFWQMLWRAPGITPHTMVMLNEGALQFYADNSLTGALNWIYDPGNRSEGMDYVMFYPTSRIGGTLAAFEPNQAITYDFISEVFTGSTSQTLAFYYQPPGCLRLLDPQLDGDNHFISDDSLMREAASLSSAAWITAQAAARMPQIYGPEPVHSWCYYFEQADLARQEGDWARVVELGDKAFSFNDYPNDPTERFVFIEGYAHENDWARVKSLSIQSYKISPHFVAPILCKLLDRIESETPASNLKESSLNDLNTEFACLP